MTQPKESVTLQHADKDRSVTNEKTNELSDRKNSVVEPVRLKHVFKFSADGRSFVKQPVDPSLFKINVPRKHLDHLLNEDLDEVSQFEVIYSILKDQLREHQQKLIALKRKRKKASRSPVREDVKQMQLQEFARYMKPFEFHGS
jgi:hypothetical protein